jgi:RND family efflux transporter MFP subunit
MRSNLAKTALVLLFASFVGPSGAQEMDLRPPVSAITQPSETSKRAFQDIGVVKKVLVKDGDMITADQVLMQLDDDIDQATLKQMKLEAESTARIEAGQAELDLRKSEWEKISQAQAGYSQREREEARLRMIGAEKQLKVSQEEHEVATLKYQAAQVKVDKMQLKAPFAGQVQKIVVKVGEAVDPRAEQGAVILVKMDPLWVEIKGLTTKDVAKMKLGDSLQVRYEDDGPSAQWRAGKIIFINPVADAGSKTQGIRLELPNPEGRFAGLHMEVKVPGTTAGAAARAD